MNELVIPGYKHDWVATGAMNKPPQCKNCRFNKTGNSFAPDWIGSDPRVAIMLTSPTSDDINQQKPLSGKWGWRIYKTYFEPWGLKWDNLIISHVIRCGMPWRFKRKMYPTGATKTHAEALCRMYDGKHAEKGKLVAGGLSTWNPDLFLITFSPYEVLSTPAYHRQILCDIGKSVTFAEAGYRPLVLMGKEPNELFLPHIKGAGGVKGWRGGYYEMEFPQKLGGGEEGLTFLGG